MVLKKRHVSRLLLNIYGWHLITNFIWPLVCNAKRKLLSMSLLWYTSLLYKLSFWNISWRITMIFYCYKNLSILLNLLFFLSLVSRYWCMLTSLFYCLSLKIPVLLSLRSVGTIFHKNGVRLSNKDKDKVVHK